MPKAHWYYLTKYMKEEAPIEIKVTTGLTIPFLYGAYCRFGYQIHSVEDLFNEILLARAPQIPVIEFCNTINFHVLKLETPDGIKRDKKKFKDVSISSNGKPLLVISYHATNLGRDITTIVKSLTNQYQSQIDQNTYSWSSNKPKMWRPFNVLELEAIEFVMQSH